MRSWPNGRWATTDPARPRAPRDSGCAGSGGYPHQRIPDAGATAKLLNGLGRHLIRPGHIHFKLSHPTCRSLTTQIYFEGDPYIDSDVVGAVKDSLIVALVRSSHAMTRCSYDFVLAARDDA
jgi:protocatechuate 3,4-dioxygenase beta subunit